MQARVKAEVFFKEGGNKNGGRIAPRRCFHEQSLEKRRGCIQTREAQLVEWRLLGQWRRHPARTAEWRRPRCVGLPGGPAARGCSVWRRQCRRRAAWCQRTGPRRRRDAAALRGPGAADRDRAVAAGGARGPPPFGLLARLPGGPGRDGYRGGRRPGIRRAHFARRGSRQIGRLGQGHFGEWHGGHLDCLWRGRPPMEGPAL
mmetsp:Transcript_95618/g.274479  ORF Transcript_95618/g.274479 Transcript_95618/m.274479 type:complete len:202 (-) Transcript_95618:1335-1940(-)